MSNTPRSISDDDAREITNFLLDKGIPQTQIASTVKRSQSWVSGIKHDRSEREKGRQEERDTLCEKLLQDRMIREMSHRRIMSSTNTQILLPDNESSESFPET